MQDVVQAKSKALWMPSVPQPVQALAGARVVVPPRCGAGVGFVVPSQFGGPNAGPLGAPLLPGGALGMLLPSAHPPLSMPGGGGQEGVMVPPLPAMSQLVHALLPRAQALVGSGQPQQGELNESSSPLFPPGQGVQVVPSRPGMPQFVPPPGQGFCGAEESGGCSSLPPNLYVDQGGFIREIPALGSMQMVAVAPQMPEGLPAGFADQIRLQISQVESTSGKMCRFRRGCKKLDCADEHPEGREIADDPESIVCRFRRKCKRGDCFYLHPSGREMDEDPSKGMCKLGKTCIRPECIFSHPEGRVTVIQVVCHSCGEVGHIQKDCPQNKQERLCRLCNQPGHMQRDCPLGHRHDDNNTYVSVTGFPEDWSANGEEALAARIAKELEVFGTVSVAPDIVENGTKAFAGFADAEHAREAVKALNGATFEIELCAPPSTVLALIGRPDEGCPEVVISGFPQRWNSSDLGSFLRGNLKKNSILDIEISPAKEGSTSGSAVVKFQDGLEARRACAELKGQKVAGKALVYTINGVEVDGEDDLDGDRRCRDRSRSRGKLRGGRREEDDSRGLSSTGRNGYDRGRDAAVVIVHIDELNLPRRPPVDPAMDDKEVYIDPLPDEAEMKPFLESFGQNDAEVYRIPDRMTGKPTRRGYVLFKDHASAERCVKAGSGQWSESERALSSQHSRRGGRDSAYPDSMIARILGPRGELINGVKSELGGTLLAVRGDGLGETDRTSSSRVHFVFKGPSEAFPKLEPALSRFVSEIHDAISAKLQNMEAPKDRKRSASRPRMVFDQKQQERDRGGRRGGRDRSPPRGCSRGDAWCPPQEWPLPPTAAGWPPPHDGQWGPHPPALPGFLGPWGPPPPGAGPWGPPTPWMGPPLAPPPPHSGPPPPHGGPQGSPIAGPQSVASQTAGAPPGQWGGPPIPSSQGWSSDRPGEGQNRDRSRSRDRGQAVPCMGSDALWSCGGGGATGAGAAPSAAGCSASHLPPAEAALGEAIVTFLRSWTEENPDGRQPNLIHLGACARIRECKAAALPPEVALRSWIEQRFYNQVALVKDADGKTTVQLVPPGVSGVPPAHEERPVRGQSPPREARSRDRSRRRRRRRAEA